MGHPLFCVCLPVWLSSHSVQQDPQMLSALATWEGGTQASHPGLGFPATYDLPGKCALCQSDSFCSESRLKVKPCQLSVGTAASGSWERQGYKNCRHQTRTQEVRDMVRGKRQHLGGHSQSYHGGILEFIIGVSFSGHYIPWKQSSFLRKAVIDENLCGRKQ